MFKPYRRLFLLVVVLTAGLKVMPLVYPQLARVIIDNLILDQTHLPRNKKIILLWTTSGGIAALAVIFAGVTLIQVKMYYKLLWGIIFDLRQRLSWHIQKLSLSFYARQKTGKLVSRIISDINQISGLIRDGGINLILDILTVLLVAGILCVMNAWLFLCSISLIPVSVITFRRLNPIIRRMSKHVQRRVAIMSGGIAERLSGISVIQAFAAEQIEHYKFTRENEKYTQQVLNQAGLASILQATGLAVVYTSHAIVLGAGGYFALRGYVTPGEIVAFMLYVPLLYGPLARLAEINVSIQQALGSLERVFELLDVAPEITNNPNPVTRLEGHGKLIFENVTFSYNTDRAVLHNINLRIDPGQKVALIGPSGAGKTTLAALVPRLYDVTQGKILIDGIDVRKVHLKTLRQTIGVVQQEPFLFSISVRENILYGKPEASNDQVIQAAKTANAHEFIKQLPHGYNTATGERGVNLSVGQRQRICLARTILKDPRILILDEATSALDSESENLVQTAMDRLMINRTSIIIAHRLSTIMNADFVVVLQNGSIIEKGTHTELWEQGKMYKYLLQQQFGPIQRLLERASSSAKTGSPP
ncbi:MAG: ABC transporter ATP-binding protein [Planctomycetota bacterium]